MSGVLRDIGRDIERGRFVAYLPIIILSQLFSKLLRRESPTFFSHLNHYFNVSGNFSDGLFRFCYLCMYLFPIAGIAFYYSLAYISQDPTLYLTISVGFVFMWSTAIYASLVEQHVNYRRKLLLAWLLGFETIGTVLLIGWFSPAVVAYPYEIWLYMVLVGFTLVQTTKIGLTNAIFAASLPFILSYRYESSITFAACLQSFGLLGTYFLASICKLVSDGYAIKSASNEDRAVAREAEIAFLLNSIPQGVLTIDEDGLIPHNYSEHTLEILGQQVIGGLEFNSVVIDQLQLSDDEKDQIIQTINTSLGQDELNFVANEDKLPLEMRFKDKVLKVTWTPKLDAAGCCESLLVTILDITVEKRSAETLAQEQQHIQKIYEVISFANPQRLAGVIDRGTASLHKGRNRIGQLPLTKAVEAALIDFHTIKGNARTTGLRGIADAAHEAEQLLVDCMAAGKAKSEVCGIKLAAQYECLTQILAEYRTILGDITKAVDTVEIAWRGSTKRIGTGQVQQLVATLERLDHPEIDVAFDSLASTDGETSLAELFIELEHRLGHTAQNLKKPAPRLALNLSDLLVSVDVAALLNDCLLHLLNNHLDHGIEAESERLRLGKDSHGKIEISAFEDEDNLILLTMDDGAGVNLRALREKGGYGLQTDQLLAKLFDHGFTTKSQATQVSGRGVGLPAARKMLQNQQGSIEIQAMGGEKDGHVAVQFKLVLPLRRAAQRCA